MTTLHYGYDSLSLDSATQLAINANHGFDFTDLFVWGGPLSIIRPLLLLVSLTYMIFPAVLGFIWVLTRPSQWSYQYLWPFFFTNFVQMFSHKDYGQMTGIRLQHIDEYGRDLRVFWPRVWFYTLPINSLLLFCLFVVR